MRAFRKIWSRWLRRNLPVYKELSRQIFQEDNRRSQLRVFLVRGGKFAHADDSVIVCILKVSDPKVKEPA